MCAFCEFYEDRQVTKMLKYIIRCRDYYLYTLLHFLSFYYLFTSLFLVARCSLKGQQTAISLVYKDR